MNGPSSIEIRSGDVDEVVASGLLRELDDELMSRYPGSPVFGIDGLQAALAQVYFVIARSGADVIGCGAFRPFDSGCVEIKRMFVRQAYRGRGVARQIEAWVLAQLDDNRQPHHPGSHGFRPPAWNAGVALDAPGSREPRFPGWGFLFDARG